MTDDTRPTALIAEDEPLMRERLKEKLAEVWPGLAVVAEAADGDEALALFDAEHPSIAFLDIRMPGRSGLDVAAAIGGECHIVFFTAYDQYAISAFDFPPATSNHPPSGSDDTPVTTGHAGWFMNSRPTTSGSAHRNPKAGLITPPVPEQSSAIATLVASDNARNTQVCARALSLGSRHAASPNPTTRINRAVVRPHVCLASTITSNGTKARVAIGIDISSARVSASRACAGVRVIAR